MKGILTLMILWCSAEETAPLLLIGHHEHYLTGASEPLRAVLEATSQPDCSAVLLADDNTSSYAATLTKGLDQHGAPRGVGIFDISTDVQDKNTTDQVLSNTFLEMRRLRQASWCVVVVVLSEDPSFLMSFAEWSLQKRLLVWATRLVVVTHLSLPDLRDLLKHHWTFSMMNAMFLNLEINTITTSWNSYAYLPYSPEGATDIKVASWSQENGLRIYINRSFFPEKYWNFYGAVVNVTQQHYPPIWIEEKYTKDDGTEGRIFSGTDGTLFHVVAKALNFSFYVIPTNSWDKVIDLVVVRESFMAPAAWDILPERLERHDMGYPYMYLPLVFAMAKPSLRPKWQNIYYPLSHEVWLGILMCLFVMPAILFAISTMWLRKFGRGNETYDVGMAVLEILATLLGENLTGRLPKSDSGRTFMVAWLTFAFIVGAAYSGNLKANLTLPKRQPRADTVEELLDVVDTVVGAAYIIPSKDFLGKSNSPLYKKLSQLISIGPEADEGLQLALENKRLAVIDFRQYTQNVIADKFTSLDGSTDVYIGHSNILPSPSSWILPHDAPYQANMNKVIHSVIESGLYEKWGSDGIDKARRESMRRQREFLAKKETGEDADSKNSSVNKASTGQTEALSLKDMQGTMFLVFIGLMAGGMSFVIEVKYTC